MEIAYPHRHLVFDETSGEARVATREGGEREAVDSAVLSDREGGPEAGEPPDTAER